MNTANEILLRIASGLPLDQAPWDGAQEDSEFPQAAVLVAVTDEAQPQVLLGRRAMHLKNHPGEIAFAGGKRELIDASPWETACREATEEVGIVPHLVQPLGEMEPLLTRTGFQVFPCIAAIPQAPELVVDAGEFDSVFFTSLSVFADPDVFRLEDMSKAGTTLSVPHYQVGDDNVWGVTAAILAQLVNVAYDAGFELQRNWTKKP